VAVRARLADNAGWSRTQRLVYPAQRRVRRQGSHRAARLSLFKGDILGVTHFLHDYYDLFLFDFRYFGESDGAITTLGHREWQDVVVAVDHLQGRGISSIGVWGFSLGAAVALLALPHTEHVDAVVADSPYVDLGAMAMDYYGNIPLLSHTLTFFTDVLARTVVGVSPATVSPLVAASSAGTPLLFIHGASDRTIPPTHFERFRSALAGKAHAEFWLIEDAGHGLTYATQRERYEARVLAFFTRHLG